MGLFYTNITLYGPSQEQVTGYLKQLHRTAYVSPTIRKFTVVYDKETDENTSALQGLALRLSQELNCKALAASVVDSDVFLYWLYDAGKLVDEYNSLPSYLDKFAVKPLPPSGGEAQKLCAAFNAGSALEKVHRIFELAAACALDNKFELDYDLAGEDIHRELAQALDMPSFAAEIGFYTIENNFPAGLDKSSLMKCEGLTVD